jgi:hypothetical protein
VEEMPCRWLLRGRDLCGSDTLMFTQEFTAELFGVRRAIVTIAAHALQRAGTIKYRRGNIEIIDLEALRACGSEGYQAVRITNIADWAGAITPLIGTRVFL